MNDVFVLQAYDKHMTKQGVLVKGVWFPDDSYGQPLQSRLHNLRSEGHELRLAKGLGFRAAGSAEPSDSDRRRDSSFRKDRNHCDFRRLEMDLECTHYKTVQPTVEDALLAVLIFINYRMKNEIYVVFSATIVLH